MAKVLMGKSLSRRSTFFIWMYASALLAPPSGSLQRFIAESGFASAVLHDTANMISIADYQGNRIRKNL
jgi:hypothetical protein